MAEQESPEYGVGDFVLLDEVSKKAFMDNLKLRFQKERIYTYIGEVVVSMNPYKTLNIFGEDVVQQYKMREMYERPPHIFALADAAYRTMKRRSEDTCIVISGTRVNYSVKTTIVCKYYFERIDETKRSMQIKIFHPFLWIILAVLHLVLITRKPIFIL